MTPAEQLKEEHQGILLMLKILDKVAARLAAGKRWRETTSSGS